MSEHNQRGRKPTVNPKIRIRRDYPALTIRLPLDMYAKLSAEAEEQGRSRAAHVEILLREIWK